MTQDALRIAGEVASSPTVILAFVVQAVFVIRWAYRAVRNHEINEAFVEDMATNHLDHIYDTEMSVVAGLNRLLEANGLEQVKVKLPPPIRFIKIAKRSAEEE